MELNITNLRKLISLLSCALACIPSLACQPNMRVDISAHKVTGHATSGERKVIVKSTISDTGSSLWKWKMTRLEDKQNLIDIQFLSATHAWAASQQGSLYTTTDGGETWRRIKSTIPTGAHITSIFFASPTLGWIAAERLGPDTLDSQKPEAWLINTTNGGQDYKIQYADKGINLSRVRFINNSEGWAVGTRFANKETRKDSLLVLHTTDQGEHWSDVSSGLSMARGVVTDVYATEPLKATILTINGNIYTTINGGQTWQEIAGIQDEPDQTYLGRLGVGQRKEMWVLGGADSLEGVWGTLAIRKPGGNWMKYEANAYFSDAIFISEDEILVSGHTHTRSKHNLNGNYKGVVLYSDDNGLNWKTIYSSVQGERIRALDIFDTNNIWAVGENGLIIHLETSSKKILTSVSK